MKESIYKEFSPTALAYLDQLQGNIGRMHEASKSCKNFCVGLVSAVLAAAIAAERGDIAFAGLLPTAAFLLLDAYYLSLERGFISIYSRFVAEYLEGRDPVLFDLNPNFEGVSRPAATLKAIFSFSVWPFYSMALMGCAVAGATI